MCKAFCDRLPRSADSFERAFTGLLKWSWHRHLDGLDARHEAARESDGYAEFSAACDRDPDPADPMDF